MSNGAAYSAADDLISLLTNEWQLSQNIKINKIYDQKTVGFGEDMFDSILIYPKNENIQYWGLYGVDYFHEIDIEMEVRSYQGYEHHNDLVNEVQRIIKTNIRRTGYVDLRIMTSVVDTEPLRNLYRHKYTIRYRSINP